MFIFTMLPFSPLSSFITPSFFIPVLATSSFSTDTILSPDCIPSFSEGPPEMAEMTTILSSIILN